MVAHGPEIFILLVILLVIVGGVLGAAWVFGTALGRGMASGRKRR